MDQFPVEGQKVRFTAETQRIEVRVGGSGETE